MAASSRSLPDVDTLDLDALRTLAREQHTALLARDLEIENLTLLLHKLKRLQFGRKSEKLDQQIAQLALFLEELEATTSAERPSPRDSGLAQASSAAVPSPARPRFPDSLPRTTQTIAPPSSTCSECRGPLRALGEDVSEMLEYVPAHFEVIRLVRPKLSCAVCQHIVQAPAPSRPITRGLAGPGLLAHVLVSKYADHLPLYRQSEIYERQGLELERSTLAGWVGGAAAALAPLVEQVRRYVLHAGKLHGDDTPVPVLAPGRGQTKTGRLWTYVRDDRPAGSAEAPAVWFAYSPDRKGEHPAAHLQGFQGVLQADGYAGFNRVYEKGTIQEASCWAHVRRKFYDLEQAHRSPLAAEALTRIGQLYAIESEIRGRAPAHRRDVRQARAAPRLADFRQWLSTQLARLSQKSATAVAIRYALGRWSALTRYCEQGLLEIDNNAAERALRAVALGRKNYLFAGSDAGGQRAAAFYSLLGSAKLNGLDPEAYLKNVLSRIADHPINRLTELLPWNIGGGCYTEPAEPTPVG